MVDYTMIEHRLYHIERFIEHPRVKTAGRVEGQIVLCTPKRATWYRLQGYDVFDFHESLGMEPEYYSVDKSANDVIIHTY